MLEQVRTEENALTVSTLAALLTQTLTEVFPGQLRVDAEIVNFKTYPSGHWYFSLTDGQATLNAVMFKGANRLVRLVPRDGLKIRAVCEINFYPPNGKLQLLVKKMQDAGEGDQKAKLEALKAKLISEGLTDLARKRPLPTLPTRIALVTSSRGAVIRDMLTVLNARWPLAAIRLYSAAVQGETAPQELTQALQRANDDRWAQVIIIGRGGGAAEDLSAFNDEHLCRAIANCQTPVVSAVGHETDSGLIDLIADVRAATPSQAAELVSPDRREIQARLVGWVDRLITKTQTQLALGEQRLELGQTRLRQAMHTATRDQRDRLRRLESLLVAPTEYIQRKASTVDVQRERLESSMARVVERKHSELKRASGQLHVLSPLATLSRGYGIVLKDAQANDRMIGSVADVKPSDPIEIRLKDGRLDARVESIEKES